MPGSTTVKKGKTRPEPAPAPQLGLFSGGATEFTTSLKNLAFAVDLKSSLGENLTTSPNGLLVAFQENDAKTSNREAKVEPISGKKKEMVMSARATATVLAKVEKSARVRVPRRAQKVTGPMVCSKSAAPAKTLMSARKETKQERRDRVVMEHLSLVKAIAIRVHESLPVHVELDDLVHAGILGLFDAATKYNPDKKVVFSSYAKHRIKGAILDSLRQLDWASRDLRRRHKQVEQITRDLCATLQRQPTEEELAAKLGVDVARWRQMAVDLRNVGLISASTRAPEHEDLPAPDFPCKPESQPDSMCAREQLKSTLETAMSSLPERYKKVVVLYYTNEMTMKEIGGILGINESRVSQIHKSALEKMAVVLQSNGITSSTAF